MNQKWMLPIVILTMLVGAGSAMALSPAASALTTGQVGNYNFQYNASNSVVSDLQYTHDGTTYNLTNQIQVTGSSNHAFSLKGTDGSVVMQNATILNTEADNTFVLMTSEMSSNVSIQLSGNLTPTSIDLNKQMSDVASYVTNKLGVNFSSTSFVYKTAVNGVVFYVFSNVKASSAPGYAYFASSTSPVLVGTIPLAALLNDVEQGNMGKANFHYNNTTGQLTGTYVSANLNVTSGNLTSFGSTVMAKTVFSTISVNATGTLGDGEDSVMLPAYQPIVMGSLFVYSGSSYIYALHDNPSMQSVVVWKNGTVNFTLGSGLTANIIATKGTNTTLSSQITTNATAFSNSTLESDHSVEAGKTAVYINGTGVRAFLFVNNGNVLVNGSSISVQTAETGKVTFVAPPGLNNMSLNLSQRISNAVKDGKIAAEVAITGTNANASIAVHFNNSVQMVVTNVTSGKAAIKLSSANHEGTNILIFVSNSVITSTSNIHVSFDGVSLSISSVNGVLNTTSSTQASFAELQTHGGVLILLHVPHFSNHSIEITSSGSTSPLSLPLGSQGKLIVAGGLVVLVVVVALAVVARSRKH